MPSELVSLCATPGTTLDQVPLLASAHLVAVRQVRLLRTRGVVMRLVMTVQLLTASPAVCHFRGSIWVSALHGLANAFCKHAGARQARASTRHAAVSGSSGR